MDIAHDRSTTASLTAGSFLDSAIDGDGDIDLVRVDLTAGTRYTFDLLGASTGAGRTLADPVLTLVDAGLNILTGDDDGGAGLDAHIAFTASLSGTYYLAASAFSGAGSYRLGMSVSAAAADDRGQTAATAGTLAAGGRSSGVIEFVGDQDWSGIQLTAGVRYALALDGAQSGQGTLSDPSLSLYDAAGTLLASNDDANGTTSDSLLLFTPQASGTYYLGAGGYADATGSYVLSATVAADDVPETADTPASLAPGAALTSRIDGDLDVDAIRVQLVAGRHYVIDMLGADAGSGLTLADPALALADDTLTVIAESDDFGATLNARLGFTPAASGTFYVLASSAVFGSGSYQVMIREDADPLAPTAAGDGDDRLTAGRGAATIDGGGGTDTLLLAGQAGDYSVARVAGGFALRHGFDRAVVLNVEQVSFDGGASAISIAEFAARSFNPYAYLAAYADLRAAFGSDGAAARAHYLSFGQAEGRDPGLFDAHLYAASSPDLARAFGTDGVLAAYHYVVYGLDEGRPITGFDPYLYGASNPDVSRAAGGDPNVMLMHYLQNGAQEGRATARFDAIEYAASNPDLALAFGADVTGLAAHYVLNGLAEGRRIDSFDAALYAAANPDLARAFGSDAAGLARHYVEHGIAEGRATMGFDPVAYLLSHVDLADAGFTVAGALGHWIDHGADEGRAGDGLFGREQTSHTATIDGTVSGLIDSAGDRDWFGVTLHASDRLSFDLAGGGGLSDPSLSLFDANGRLLASGGGAGATLLYTAAADGLYYLVAQAGDPAATGSYSLTIDSHFLI